LETEKDWCINQLNGSNLNANDFAHAQGCESAYQWAIEQLQALEANPNEMPSSDVGWDDIEDGNNWNVLQKLLYLLETEAAYIDSDLNTGTYEELEESFHVGGYESLLHAVNIVRWFNK
jgi:hypothetical protein